MSLFVWFYVYAHLHVSWERKIKKKEILEKEKVSENKSTN